MKAFFLIDTPLAGEIAYSVAHQLSEEPRKCRIIAFLMQPDYFHEKFPHIVNELTEANNITLASEKDYPQYGRVKILRAIKPDIYITIDDTDPLEADFLIAAKYLNLPTLLIQPGITGEFPFTWRNVKMVANLFTRFRAISTEYSRIWGTLGETGLNLWGRLNFIFRHLLMRFRRKYSGWCDKIAVSGERARELFINQGVSAHKIVITGLPRLDSIITKSTERDEFIHKLSVGKGERKVVLYLPDYAAEHKMITFAAQEEIARCIISSCQQITEVLLVIKPHPGEDPDYYSVMAKDLNSDALIYRGTHLHDLIRASDAVITGISTTGLETLALGKPLVNINLHTRGGYFPHKWEYIPYIRSGVAFGVHHLDELPDAIKRALHDDDNEEEKKKLMARSVRFVSDYLYKLDGKASQRVADLIIEMTKGKK